MGSTRTSKLGSTGGGASREDLLGRVLVEGLDFPLPHAGGEGDCVAGPRGLAWDRRAQTLPDSLTYLTNSGMFQDKGKMPCWLLEDRVSRLMGMPSGVCKETQRDVGEVAPLSSLSSLTPSAAIVSTEAAIKYVDLSHILGLGI